MEHAAGMIDVAFALEGHALPHEHRYALADALQDALPWLASEPGAGVHRLNVVHSGSADDLVSRRTRLMLRVPRSRADDACSLSGTRLELGSHRLRAGRAHCRELLPHGTLYAYLVAAQTTDEIAFIASLEHELDALGIRVQPVCGRWHVAERGQLVGCSLMLSGLDRAQSLVLLERGLGPHRRLGCGLFIPHRSAAAVGTPS